MRARSSGVAAIVRQPAAQRRAEAPPVVVDLGARRRDRSADHGHAARRGRARPIARRAEPASDLLARHVDGRVVADHGCAAGPARDGRARRVRRRSPAWCTRSRCCARSRRARSTRSSPPASCRAAASSRRRSRTRGVPAQWVDSRTVITTDAEHTARGAGHDRDVRRKANAVLRPIAAAGRVAVIGGFIGATAQGVDDDARTRRVGLLGGDRRLVPRRRRDSDLDRRRRHADRGSADRLGAAARAVSCRSPKRPSSRTSARRCCTRARFCPPSARTSRSGS